VPKDGFLKDVELVKVNEIYYLRFTWNIYDSDTGTYRTGTTDVNVEDLVKDIDENNTNTGRGVDVDVWYNETDKKMNVSATTTVVINNADGTGTKTFSKSNAVNSLTSYTLNSTSGDVKSTAANTNWTYDPFAEKKNIVVPTDASHINRKTVSWSYGSVTSETGNTYDPGDGTVNTTNSSRTMSFVIPKALKDLNNNLSNLKFNTGTTNVNDSPYNGSVEKTITIPSDASHIANRSVSWSYGSVTGETGGSYAPSQAINGSFVIPKCVGDMNRSKFNYSYGSVSAKSSSDNGTYDPGEECNNAATDSIVIPTCVADLKNWNGSCYSFDDNLCVTGDVTATGSFYSTSDERKKENIEYIDKASKYKVANIPLKSFNYKEDESKRKMYGVIAQDVEAAGLNELVHTDEQGIKAVDYTSLLILRIANLESTIAQMHKKLVDLEEKVNGK
jgi:hypothetical protein